MHKQPKPIRHRVARSALALAVFGLAPVLHAASDSVDYVDVTSGDGIYINDGKIVVEPVNGTYANIVSGNTVTYHRRLKAGCKGYQKSLVNTFVSFGTETVGGGLLEASNLFRVGVPHQHADSIPYTEAVLNVPLDKLGFDPVQACQDMLATKMQQGLTKMQVMNSDQVLNRNVSFTGVAACGKIGGDNTYYEADIIGGNLKVICKGGPSGPVSQVAQPKLPIVAVPLGGGGQIQAGHQPLQITQAQVMTNVLHDSGQCPANKQFSVGYQGHGKGHVRFHVIKNGQEIYTSVPLAYDGADGFVQRNFFYQVGLDPQKPWEVVGKELERSFSLLFEIKDEKADDFDWSPHGYYTGLDWFYTCQPKLNAVIPNQPNMGYGQQQAPLPPAMPGGKIQAQPVGPMPPAAPAGKIQAQPAGPQPPAAPNRVQVPATPQPPTAPSRLQAPTPKPAPIGTIQAQPVEPQPAPQLKIAPQTVEPEQPKRATN